MLYSLYIQGVHKITFYICVADSVCSSWRLSPVLLNPYPSLSRIFGECGPPPHLLVGSSASNGIRRPAATFFSVAGLLLAGAPDGAYFRRCWEWFTDCRAALGYVCIGNCKCTVDSQFGDSGCRLYHYETAVRKVGYDPGTLYGFGEHRE